MRQRILRWLVPVLVAGFLALPAAHAQSTASAEEAGPSKTAALPYGIALVSTVIVLVIVCSPSRKSFQT